jgi:HAD superfamily hydrolase (TIGR01509 family)
MTSAGYHAVVFDMDGVIADSEPVYYSAINEVLAPLGKSFTPELQRAIMGHGVAETWEVVARELALEGPLDGLVAAYDRELRRQLAQIRETLPGVRPLIKALRRFTVPVGLASSSWPGWIDALLNGVGLQGAFDAVASAVEVEHAKPAPDVYLLAAERLGVPSARCIALEDTPTGVASAKAAGMLAVQVRASSTAFPPLPEADIVLDSLESFDLALLAAGHDGE